MKSRRQSSLLILLFLAMILNLYHLNKKEPCNISNSLQSKVKGDRVTLVSAYYKVPSKHSHTEFLGWMEGLLQTTDNLVIFTEEWLIPVMEQAANGSRHHGNTKYVISNISDSMVGKRYRQSAWAAQLSVDLEAELHKTVETYWIWNEKVEMVRRVVEENPFNSDLFFWVDIGYLRTSGGRYKNKKWVRKEVFPSDCITVLVVEEFTGDDLKLNDESRSEIQFNNPKWRLAGGIWGGTAGAVLAWHKEYYSTLDRYMEQERFAGNDQAIMATTCMENPSLCCMVSSPKDYWNSWFWFDVFMADLVESPFYSFVRP